MLRQVGPMLGPSWVYVGPSWAYVGLCWAHLGPMSGLSWAHVGLCWAIYVETILRCNLFRSGPLAGAQNHVKTDVF